MEESRFLKTFGVGIDIKRPVAIRPFELVEGDTGNRINVHVTDDGADADLTNCFVTAVFSNSAGISVQDSGHGSVTVSGSTVTIDVDPASFAPGMVECELQIYSSSEGAPSVMEDCDVLVTTAKFNFSCRRAILNGETIELTPQLPILTDIANTITEAEAARTAAEAARAAAEAERQQNETARNTKELQRRASENSRHDAETARAFAETERLQAETARASAEQERSTAETARQTAEAERAEAELHRCSEEAIRASKEGQRNTAEGIRQSGEAARAAAEAARQAALAEHIASCGQGVLTDDEDPDASAEGEPGRLRFSTESGDIFLCTASHGAEGGTPAYREWEPLEKRADWKKLSETTLSEAAAAIEITEDMNGRPFSCSELKLTLIGTMTNGNAGAVYLNGYTDRKMTFAAFTNLSSSNMASSIAILYFSKPSRGYAICRKSYGGDNSTGAAASKNDATAIFRRDGFSAYTAVKLVCTSSNAVFAAGTTAILEGRDIP